MVVDVVVVAAVQARPPRGQVYSSSKNSQSSLFHPMGRAVPEKVFFCGKAQIMTDSVWCTSFSLGLLGVWAGIWSIIYLFI